MLNLADEMEVTYMSRFWMYEGARLCTCRVLYVMSRVLNMMW